MSSQDLEEQLFRDEVQSVKQWWSEPRWRYTKRPFTAEQIVSKRGNLSIEYPSNSQSKKLWNVLERRFEVRLCMLFKLILPTLALESRCELHIWCSGANHAHADGEVSGHGLRFWLAMFFYGIIHG